MLDAQDKSFITKRVVVVACILLIAGGSVIGGLDKKLAGKINQLSASIDQLAAQVRPFASNDTPVVLIGGSLDFKAKATNNWSGTSSPYTMSLSTPVQTIALMSDYNQAAQDGDSTKDATRIDVSAAATWKVDEYISSSQLAASIIPNATGNSLTLTASKGYLCADANKDDLTYAPDDKCDATAEKRVPFDHFVVTAYADAAATQVLSTATISCYDKNKNQGHCRVVLRE